MIDQNMPIEEKDSLPGQPVGEATPLVDPLMSNPTSTSVPLNVTSPPDESSVPPPPTVIVPGNGGGISGWFYFIFGITVIVFFLVTSLLILQITQKQKFADTGGVSGVVPKVSSAIVATPSLAPTSLATDSAVVKLNNVGSSDDEASIEADLKNTDLTVLDQSLNTVDTQVNNSF